MTRKPSLLSVVTLGAATALALTASEPAAHAQRVSFTYKGQIVPYKVPETGLYEIIAFGAQGGNGRNGPGGRGAKISGTFSLTAGEILQIAVGRAGGDGDGGGGGGGSFVVALDGTPLGTPLVIAGGGGGGGLAQDPSITVPGQGGGLTGPDGGGAGFGGAGGTGGHGGDGGLCGGGGGGFLSPGGSNNAFFCGTTGAGGAFPGLAGGSPLGGFGGGGGARGAGGGGGYSGGGGSTVTSPGFGGGGGGGSYSADRDQIPVPDLQTGDGEVVILQLAPAFAGTPGKATCHGKSVSALAKRYGGLNNAAAALGFASVDALQGSIQEWCVA